MLHWNVLTARPSLPIAWRSATLAPRLPLVDSGIPSIHLAWSSTFWCLTRWRNMLDRVRQSKLHVCRLSPVGNILSLPNSGCRFVTACVRAFVRTVVTFQSL